MRKTQIVNTLLYISVVLTILCSLLVLPTKRRKEINIKAVAFTHKVIDCATELLALVQAAEIGQKGYLITNNKEHLRPYFGNLGYIKERVRTLKTLTKDDPVQYKNTIRLEREIYNKLLILEKSITLHRPDSAFNSEEIYMVEKEKQYTDSVSLVMKRILAIEKNKLKKQSQSLQKSIQYNTVISYLSLFFIGCMSLAALIVINKKQKENDALIDKLNEYNLKLEEQISERTRELENVNSHLRVLNEDKNKFLGMAVHDLKNPLSTIKGLVNILQLTGKQNLSPEQKEILNHINKSTSRMTKLIKDLLDVNKIDQGAIEINLEKTDLLELIENVVFSFKDQTVNKDISLIVNSEMSEQNVTTDRNALTRVLENLLSNAIKFSPKGKKVFIILKGNAANYRISIKDEGPGIKDEEKHLLFGKFQRLSNRPTEGESSSGLGLSIVKSLVESLNGRIEYQSKVGEGTTFTLLFKA